jgi:hypothetical protein
MLVLSDRGLYYLELSLIPAAFQVTHHFVFCFVCAYLPRSRNIHPGQLQTRTTKQVGMRVTFHCVTASVIFGLGGGYYAILIGRTMYIYGGAFCVILKWLGDQKLLVAITLLHARELLTKYRM